MSMATRNDDRVSSARLLDMLKGLQESRHLGSEPEVETETTQHVYVPDQIPRPVGTVTSEEAYYGAFKPTTEALTLPIYVYGPYVVPVGIVSFNECEPTILATINYSKEYTVDENTFMMYGDSELPEDYADFGNTWNGFAINGIGDYWECVNTSEPRGRIYYFSDKQPVTEDITTTTKTKHPIKQDYLPNADWTQNDPDGEGYVQGRTHWVERTTGDIPVTNESYMSFISEMTKPEGFKVGSVTWKPNFEATYFETEDGGMAMNGYMLCEDENHVPITDFSAVMGGTFVNGVVVVDYTAFVPNMYVVLCKYNGQETQADYILGVTEVVHKLNEKFYDKTNENALKNEIYANVDEKFIYKTLEVLHNTKCGVILDDASELVKFLELNNYEKTDYSYHTTYELSGNNGNILVAIRDEISNRSYTYVAIINNSSQNFTWEYTFTNIISIAMNFTNIPWSKLIDENVLIFYTNDDASSFEDKIYWFETDNSVTINVDNSKLTIGTTYFDRVNFNTNSSKWAIFFNPYSKIKNGDIKYFANGEISKFYSFDTETTYTLDSGNNVKITDIYLNGAYVSARTMGGKLGGINGNHMSGGEEKTRSKNNWFSLVVDDPTFKWEALDEVIDVHKIFTFEQEYSGITNTNRLECWFDSNYDLHVKNLESRNINVPRDFSISFTWLSKFLMPVISRTGAYSSDI